MLFKASQVSSIDNSGSFINKILQIYGAYVASVGSLLLVLPSRASFRKRIRRSKFYRAVCVQSRSFVFRKTGFYIRSWLNACVLLKPKERLCVPLSNRVTGFLFAELRFKRFARLLTLTIYII
jgi:ribosomal protein L14